LRTLDLGEDRKGKGNVFELAWNPARARNPDRACGDDDLLLDEFCGGRRRRGGPSMGWDRFNIRSSDGIQQGRKGADRLPRPWQDRLAAESGSSAAGPAGDPDWRRVASEPGDPAQEDCKGSGEEGNRRRGGRASALHAPVPAEHSWYSRPFGSTGACRGGRG